MLKYFDDDLLDKLFGFCYARTSDSHEAEELCSDIVYALLKAAHRNGEIENVYPFIWRVARNVYADFSNNRRKRTETIYEGDSEEILLGLAEEDYSDDTTGLLSSGISQNGVPDKSISRSNDHVLHRRSSTRADSEEARNERRRCRQRLFSARQKIKSEVEEMTDTYNKPVALDKINFVIWGTGNPRHGEIREMYAEECFPDISYGFVIKSR